MHQKVDVLIFIDIYPKKVVLRIFFSCFAFLSSYLLATIMLGTKKQTNNDKILQWHFSTMVPSLL